jgi:hypothetical protein
VCCFVSIAAAQSLKCGLDVMPTLALNLQRSSDLSLKAATRLEDIPKRAGTPCKLVCRLRQKRLVTTKG